jgi:peptidoglycan biosynthesis protein MviN/MurJ (putative lipid II flippase)
LDSRLTKVNKLLIGISVSIAAGWITTMLFYWLYKQKSGLPESGWIYLGLWIAGILPASVLTGLWIRDFARWKLFYALLTMAVSAALAPLVLAAFSFAFFGGIKE